MAKEDMLDEAGESSGVFVWVALLQIRSIDAPGEAPRLHPGGTVRVYALAETRETAMMAIVEELTSQAYELLELEWLDPVTATDWPHSWDEEDLQNYDLAAESNQVVIGKIERWDRGKS